MNKPWTDEELGFLQDHDDWSTRRIADELCRTPGVVRKKRRQLRSGWVPKLEMWKGYEDDFVSANQTMSTSAIAAHLGRTADSVSHRRRYLQRRGDAVRKYAHNSSPMVIGARSLLAKTCPDCGLLLQANWFHSNTNGGRTTVCSACKNKVRPPRPRQKDAENRRRTRESSSRFQALTVAGASKTRQPWTDADFAVLEDPDLTVLQKALTLHRTYHATVSYCAKGGFKSFVGLGDPERDQWMIDNPNLDRLEEITASLPAPQEAPMVPETPERTAPSWDWDDADLVAS